MTETPPDEEPGRGDGGDGVAVAIAEREAPGAAIEALPADPSAVASAADARAPRATRPWWLLVAAVLAAVPLARMARWVLSGTETQYADYWLMLDEILLPSGGFRLDELFTFSNDHPVAIPKMVYWLNLHNTGGSNIVLGLVVVATVAAQLVLLAVVLRRSSMPSAAKVVVLVAASALLFTPLGAWNFLKAMSGTAWLSANAFAVAALVSRWHGRVWAACAFGVLACMCYGTGLAVWPALFIVGFLVDRRVRTQWPTALFTAGVTVAYLMGRSSGGERPDVAGPGRLLRYFLEVLSGPLVSYDFEASVWVGAGVVAVAVVVGGAAVLLAEWREVAPWMGLSVFGCVSSMLVAFGRADLTIEFGSNRHASLGALVLVGTVGMLGTVVAASGRISAHRRSARLASTFAMAVAALGTIAAGVFADSTELDRVQSGYARQDRLAIALRFGFAGGTTAPLGGLAAMPDGIEALLDATNHLPFGVRDGLDCGLAGQHIADDAVLPAVPDAIGVRLAEEPRTTERTAVSAGWIRDDDDLVRCIVVVNGDGDVIGAGAMGPRREGYGPSREIPPGTDGFIVVEPVGTSDARYLLVLRDGTFAAIPEAEEAIRL